jgi:hypothetical protein
MSPRCAPPLFCSIYGVLLGTQVLEPTIKLPVCCLRFYAWQLSSGFALESCLCGWLVLQPKPTCRIIWCVVICWSVETDLSDHLLRGFLCFYFSDHVAILDMSRIGVESGCKLTSTLGFCRKHLTSTVLPRRVMCCPRSLTSKYDLMSK